MTVSTDLNPTMTSTSDDFLDYALTHGFGELHINVDAKTGMKTIVAIHSTKLGPALGGCRFIEYPNTEAAIKDAMRLAVGMSSKAALAKLPLGGGKAVIIKPHGDYDRTAYLRRFGQFINGLNGQYITAVDSGTSLEDMDIIAEHTPYVASLSAQHGDPSPTTALGVFVGIKAAVQFKLKRASLSGLHIAIQGLGHVGYGLAQYLHQAGATLTVADVDPASVERAVREFNATFVSPEDIHTIPCDVFAPCALGAILNSSTIPQLNTPIIAGAANNQLEHSYHGQALFDRDILYAPDYVINSGGLIFAAMKYLHTTEDQLQTKVDGIGMTLTQIFERSVNQQQPTNVISDQMAREMLA